MAAQQDDSGRAWDQCIFRGLTKFGQGALVGLVASAIIFKRKRWAFIMGVGYGLGMAYAVCDYELNIKGPVIPCGQEVDKEDKKKEEEKKRKAEWEAEKEKERNEEKTMCVDD